MSFYTNTISVEWNMKFNRKILLLMGLLLFSLNFFATVPSAAFSSDSFSQDTFDSFTWQFTSPLSMSYFCFSDGDLMRVAFVATITEDYYGFLYDTLYLYYYNQSAGNSGWTAIIFDETARYNGTVYVPPGFGYALMPILIPHNATAVVTGLDNWYDSHTSYDNSSWIAGPNGYDGTYSAWEGLALGEFGKYREEFKFNSEGVMESYRGYMGTGSGWALLMKFDLQAEGIPGFSGYITLLTFGITLITAVIFLRKKEVL